MAKKLQRQIDNTFKAVAVMLPSPILNLGRVSSFQIFLLYLYFLQRPFIVHDIVYRNSSISGHLVTIFQKVGDQLFFLDAFEMPHS